MCIRDRSNSYLAKPEASAEGYFNLLFQLPLLNTIFLPLILAVMASRICDAENKGNTYKLLCTMQEKKKIFDAKLLLGGIYILFLTLLEGANVLDVYKRQTIRSPIIWGFPIMWGFSITRDFSITWGFPTIRPVSCS